MKAFVRKKGEETRIPTQLLFEKKGLTVYWAEHQIKQPAMTCMSIVSCNIKEEK